MPESRSTITVETGDSVRRLQELTDAVDKAQEAYKEAAKSNDHAKTVAAQKVWKEATRELAKHTQALERTELAAKELSSMTLVQLERRQRDLIYQLKRTHERHHRRAARPERADPEGRARPQAAAWPHGQRYGGGRQDGGRAQNGTQLPIRRIPRGYRQHRRGDRRAQEGRGGI